MPAAVCEVSSYSDREITIAASVLDESRAHVGRRLAQSIEPAARLIDHGWLETFRGYFATGSYTRGRGDTDYLSSRAVSAANVVQACTDGRLPTFKDNRERAISREGERLVFQTVAADLGVMLDRAPAEVPKAPVSWYANDLQTPLAADSVLRAELTVKLLAFADSDA
jgi:hypothetical protein